MKDGIINVYKPKGLTSNDCIYKMRSIIGIRKLGHAGTLDPMASGVLPILINRGTRTLEYMDSFFKTYRVGMILGVKTSTDDVTGEILSQYDKELSLLTKIDCIGEFLGLIDQMPPMYSAVRINGRKLYSYMYDGDQTEIENVASKVKPRQIYIEDIVVNEIKWISKNEIEDCDFIDKLPDNLPYISLDVTCSKGTYIRSICRDLGDKIGTYGTMISLERTKVGCFTKEDSVTLEELKEIAFNNNFIEKVSEDRIRSTGKFKDEIPEVFHKYVKPLDYSLDLFGKVEVNHEMALKFLDGWHLGYNEVEIVRKPTYVNIVDKELLRDVNDEGSYPGLKVHPEYLKAYTVYSKDDDRFLGVVIHSDKYHKLVSDKIFLRREEL